MDESTQREPIRLPDLGVDATELTLSIWLVPLGAPVAIGDRVVEILAGAATVDLPAPCRGVLVQKLVPEDSPVHTGQILGWVQRATSSAD